MKCWSIIDGKAEPLKWQYVSRSERNPSRHFKVLRHWSCPLMRVLCQAEVGGLTKWIIWHLLLHLFFYFYVLSNCKKKPGVCPPARCIDLANHLYLTAFQVLTERIISMSSIWLQHYRMAALHSQPLNYPDTPCMAPAEQWRSDLKGYSSWQVYADQLILSL